MLGARGWLLDTHAFFWMVQGDGRLRRKLEPHQLDSAADAKRLHLSAISVWEIAMLESKKRLDLGMECRVWVEAALLASRVRLAPLDPEVSVLSTRLPEFPNSDPADRIIVATVMLRDWMVVTADKAILRYLESQNREVLAL